MNIDEISDRALAMAVREALTSKWDLSAQSMHFLHELLHRAAEIDAATPIAPAAAVPDGYVLVPRRLTAENGAKAALIGEFSITVRHACDECDSYDDICGVCGGEGIIEAEVPIPWTTIKRIHDRVVELFGSAPRPQEPQS